MIATVEILVESMKLGNSLSDVTNASRSGQLIMNIFIRACVAAITSEELANDLMSNLCVPFVPASLQLRFMQYLLSKVESTVEVAINRAYSKKLRARVDPGHGDQVENIHPVSSSQSAACALLT